MGVAPCGSSKRLFKQGLCLGYCQLCVLFLLLCTRRRGAERPVVATLLYVPETARTEQQPGGCRLTQTPVRRRGLVRGLIDTPREEVSSVAGDTNFRWQ